MKNYWIGIFLVFIFITLSSAKDVYLGNLLQRVDIYFSLFFCSFVMLLYFNITQRRTYTALLTLIRNNYKAVIMFNLSTALSWIGVFYSLKFLEPAIAIVLVTSIGPLLTIWFSKIFQNNAPIIPIEFYASIGIVLTTVLAVYFIGNGYSGKETNIFETILGVVAAFVSGASIVLNTLFSKHLYKQRWSPQQTLAVRYFLLVFLAAILAVPQVGTSQVESLDILFLLLTAIIGFILPQASLQAGIAKVEPITVATICAIYPLIAFGFQMFDGRLTLTLYSVLSIMLSIVFILMATLGRHYHLRSELQLVNNGL